MLRTKMLVLAATVGVFGTLVGTASTASAAEPRLSGHDCGDGDWSSCMDKWKEFAHHGGDSSGKAIACSDGYHTVKDARDKDGESLSIKHDSYKGHDECWIVRYDG